MSFDSQALGVGDRIWNGDPQEPPLPKFPAPASILVPDESALPRVVEEVTAVFNANLRPLPPSPDVIDAKVSTGEAGEKDVADYAEAKFRSDGQRADLLMRVKAGGNRCRDVVEHIQRNTAAACAQLDATPEVVRTLANTTISWWGANAPYTLKLVASWIVLLGLIAADWFNATNMAFASGVPFLETRLAAASFAFIFVFAGFWLIESALDSAPEAERFYLLRMIRWTGWPVGLVSLLTFGYAMGSQQNGGFSFAAATSSVPVQALTVIAMLAMAFSLVAAAHFVRSAWKALLPFEERPNEQRTRVLKLIQRLEQASRQWRQALQCCVAAEARLDNDLAANVAEHLAQLAAARERVAAQRRRREAEGDVVAAHRQLLTAKELLKRHTH
jgi:hypothetical protein